MQNEMRREDMLWRSSLLIDLRQLAGGNVWDFPFGQEGYSE